LDSSAVFVCACLQMRLQGMWTKERKYRNRYVLDLVWMFKWNMIGVVWEGEGLLYIKCNDKLEVEGTLLWPYGI